jgi:DNA polymerase III epsilon subunit family exonuclease
MMNNMTTADSSDATHISDVLFTVVDCETTGFYAETHRVLQLGAVIVSGSGAIIDQFDTIVRPECPETYEHGAEHIHGITAEQVNKGTPLRIALQQLLDFGSQHIFVAHNAPFDIGFLMAEAQRVGISDPYSRWLSRSLDTVALSRRVDRDSERSHKLGSLCEYYGVDPGHAHNALADAKAAAMLLPKILSDLNIHSIDQLDAVLLS